MEEQSYRSTYRRTPFAMAGLAAVLIAIVGGSAAAIHFVDDGNMLLRVMVWIVGLAVFATAAIAVIAFRVHRWTIEATRLRIEERPAVPFTGLRRRALIPFGDIAAIRNVESGMDAVVEIANRDGAVYRISQVVAKPGVAPPSLAAFAENLRAAQAASGAPSAEIGEGLSFWNTPPGLALLGIMFLIAVGFAAAAGVALFGGGIGVRARGGEALAIALALPVGVGWMIVKALRRRRTVLAQR